MSKLFRRRGMWNGNCANGWRPTFGVLMCLVLVMMGCASSKKSVEEQLAEMQSVKGEKTSKVFLSGYKSADEVDQSSLKFDVWKIDANAYPQVVKLYARVYDTLGNFVTNLAPPVHHSQEYWTTLKEVLGKKVTPIKEFTVREFGDGDSIPFAVNLLVDYSGSMNGVMDALHEGTELFIGLKQPYDMISVASFNKEHSIKVPFSSDTKYLLNTFRSKKDEGFGKYTALYDGLMKSILQFDSLPQSMPRILVAFSDGDDNFSQTKAAELFKAAKERNVAVFTVGFGYAQDKTLEYISQNTGGKYYQVYGKKDLIQVFKEIYRSLRNYYLITYKPPMYAGWHNVEVALSLPRQLEPYIAKSKYDKSDINWLSEVGVKFSKPIQFDYNQSTIKSESENILDEIADQLLLYQTIWLRVKGHTDNSGTEEYNQRLSEARAKAVADALMRRGIEAKRLQTVGFGMSQPIALNDTEENRAKNRRTEFEIIRK